MLEGLVEILVRPIFEFLIQCAGYATAWLLLPVFTFGLLRVEPGRKGRFVKLGRGSIVKQPGGHYLVEAEVASFIGLLLWGIAFLVFLIARP